MAQTSHSDVMIDGCNHNLEECEGCSRRDGFIGNGTLWYHDEYQVPQICYWCKACSAHFQYEWMPKQ